MKRIKAVSLVVALAFLAGAVEAKGWMTPDFKAGITRGKSLALLPAHAEMIKQKVVMTDELIEEAIALEGSAMETVKASLESMGYQVRTVTTDELAADPGLQALARAVGERYDDEWRRIVRKPKRIRFKRYGVGEDSKKLADRLGVDGLLLVRVQAVLVGGGRKALAYFVPVGGGTSYVRVDLAAVDGETGTVESYFAGIQVCGNKKLKQRAGFVVGKAFKRGLKKYPAEGEIVKVKKKEADLVAQAGEEEEEDDASVLSDLEALLGAPDPDDEAED